MKTDVHFSQKKTEFSIGFIKVLLQAIATSTCSAMSEESRLRFRGAIPEAIIWYGFCVRVDTLFRSVCQGEFGIWYQAPLFWPSQVSWCTVNRGHVFTSLRLGCCFIPWSISLPGKYSHSRSEFHCYNRQPLQPVFLVLGPIVRSVVSKATHLVIPVRMAC